MIDKLDEMEDDGIDTIFFNSLSFDFGAIFMKDFTWVGLSIFLVFAYMWFTLKSFWMTANSMLNIVMSFPITLVVYKGIFQISYYSFLHNLLVFVVLGIAADNVFVFTDAWKETSHIDSIKKDKLKRMNYTWRRAAKASFVTTFTTAIAFLANAFSKLMPIKSFGIFAAVLIPLNYLQVILVFPAILIIHERYFSTLFSKIWSLIKKKKDDEPSEPKQPKPPLLSRFFRGPYITFLKYARWVIIPACVLWLGFCIWRVALMEALTEEEEFLPSNHPV